MSPYNPRTLRRYAAKASVTIEVIRETGTRGASVKTTVHFSGGDWSRIDRVEDLDRLAMFVEVEPFIDFKEKEEEESDPWENIGITI